MKYKDTVLVIKGIDIKAEQLDYNNITSILETKIGKFVFN
jgi:hypothetical protein